MKFDLWRILGNDLPPRHDPAQTEANLSFIINHETRFDNCNKKFLLNRIVDDKKLERLIDEITKNEMGYSVIPFEKDIFDTLGDREKKAAYLTNLNPARNFCISKSLDQGADVVCPMDGGMFFRDDGWSRLEIVCKENPKDGFFSLATWRVSEYRDAIDMTSRPILFSTYKFGDTSAVGPTEFQLIFTRHADCFFDDDLVYGNEDKVELLYRLGIPGLWDHWNPYLYELATKKQSTFYGEVKNSSFVCRLPSGNPEADADNQLRGKLRKQGLNSLIDHIEGIQ